MKSILIFASLAGIAAAIAVYFTSQGFNTDDTAADYVTDADVEAFDIRENSGDPYPVL